MSIVAVYPDEATFIAASQRIAERRSEGSDTFGATLVKAKLGQVYRNLISCFAPPKFIIPNTISRPNLSVPETIWQFSKLSWKANREQIYDK